MGKRFENSAPVVSQKSPPSSNNQRRAQAKRDAIEWLKTTWPDGFTDPPKPLAVGAQQTVQAVAIEAGFSPGTVKAALATWCNRPAYLHALAAGGHRVGLDGTPDEPVTAEHADHAREKMRQQREIRRQRRASRQQAGSGTTERNQEDKAPPRKVAGETPRPTLTLRKSR